MLYEEIRLNFEYFDWGLFDILRGDSDGEKNKPIPCTDPNQKICDEVQGLMECSSEYGYYVRAANNCRYDEICLIVDGDSNASCAKKCEVKDRESYDEENDLTFVCTENSDGTLYYKENGPYYYAKCITGDDAKEALDDWENFSKKSWTETYGEREFTAFKYTSGYHAPLDCNLNAEDVKNEGCPAMYTYCDKPGETMCCGGNAYSCLTDDTDSSKSLYKQLYQGIDPVYDLIEVLSAGRVDNRPMWIPTFCAVEGSTCKISEERGAECVMNDLTCEFSEDKSTYKFDGYDMQISDFVCAKFPKDKGYSLAQTLCHVKKDGSSYVSLFFPLPLYGGGPWKSYQCDEKGKVIEPEN